MAQFIPTAAEKDTINKIRESLVEASGWEDIKLDSFILKWLKYHDNDVEKVKKGLLEAYKYRIESGFETILKDYTPDPEITKLLVGANYDTSGFDKGNCPVIILDVPSYNPKKIISKFGIPALIKYGDYELARMEQICRDKHTDAKPVQQVVAIVDAKKATFKQLTSLLDPKLVQTGIEEALKREAHFPDPLKLAVIVNAGRVAKVAYKIVKPFAPKKVLKNVKLFPKINAKAKKLLLDNIDADQLPQKYGGTKKGGEVEDLSVTGNDDDEAEEDGGEDMVEVKVGSGKKHKLEYQIDEPNTQICWSFQTDDRQIGFSVFLGTKEETLVPYQKSGNLLQVGSITCEKAGKYTLCFNNKENRFKSVQLSFIVIVIPPGQKEADGEMDD